ncbi:unnamed protein product [Vitrella brassicaformis CCMP3155]|uniref:OTU domain-containing protein n=1 Tax=Vitrella brassicaformis (strain CCMP3155) TaxID=1169540 RepID=A0A0G4EVC0_VITBC|nr:unnamed protein product [Vitrella brassicaformis CCMP3155]|eukprot:CEM02341.1 unnamed protein product [Vitrella brassicaformis CCMP3155]
MPGMKVTPSIIRRMSPQDQQRWRESDVAEVDKLEQYETYVWRKRRDVPRGAQKDDQGRRAAEDTACHQRRILAQQIAAQLPADGQKLAGMKAVIKQLVTQLGVSSTFCQLRRYHQDRHGGRGGECRGCVWEETFTPPSPPLNFIPQPPSTPSSLSQGHQLEPVVAEVPRLSARARVDGYRWGRHDRRFVRTNNAGRGDCLFIAAAQALNLVPREEVIDMNVVHDFRRNTVAAVNELWPYQFALPKSFRCSRCSRSLLFLRSSPSTLCVNISNIDSERADAHRFAQLRSALLACSAAHCHTHMWEESIVAAIRQASGL